MVGASGEACGKARVKLAAKRSGAAAQEIDDQQDRNRHTEQPKKDVADFANRELARIRRCTAELAALVAFASSYSFSSP